MNNPLNSQSATPLDSNWYIEDLRKKDIQIAHMDSKMEKYHFENILPRNISMDTLHPEYHNVVHY